MLTPKLYRFYDSIGFMVDDWWNDLLIAPQLPRVSPKRTCGDVYQWRGERGGFRIGDFLNAEP